MGTLVNVNETGIASRHWRNMLQCLGRGGMLIVKYYYYWIAVFVFLIDFITKKVIENKLAIGEKINVLGDGFLSSPHIATEVRLSEFYRSRRYCSLHNAAGCCRNRMVHV